MRKSVGDWMAIFRKSTGFGPLRHPKLVPNQLSSIRRYRLCEWRVNMIPHKPLNLISPATRRTANPAHPTRHRFFCHRRHEIISQIQARMPSDGKSRCGPRQPPPPTTTVPHHSPSPSTPESTPTSSPPTQPFKQARIKLYRERARRNAHLFAPNGGGNLFGRSMTYRFAMSCFWAGLAFDELEVSGQGVSRGGGRGRSDLWGWCEIYGGGKGV